MELKQTHVITMGCQMLADVCLSISKHIWSGLQKQTWMQNYCIQSNEYEQTGCKKTHIHLHITHKDAISPFLFCLKIDFWNNGIKGA